MRTYLMSQPKPPAGHLGLVEALQACALTWESSRDAAWPRFRTALVDGRVGTLRREGDGTESRVIPTTWAALENDSAYSTGLHEHPGALRFGVQKFAAAFVNESDLESLLSDGRSPRGGEPHTDKGDTRASNIDFEAAQADWRKKRGRKERYDWHGMYRHLLACHERTPLTRESADKAAEEFFRSKGSEGEYPDSLKAKTRAIFKGVTRTRTLRDVLAEGAKGLPE